MKLKSLIIQRFPSVLNYYIPRLKSVAIEPTNACNLSCQMCYAQRPELHPPRGKGLMERSLYTKIVDELTAIQSVSSLGINFGGESLLHKNFLDMIRYASDKNRFSIGFNTNALYLTSEVARALVEAQISYLSVSLDGLKEQHELLRCGSKYEVVERHIRQLMAIRGPKTKPEIMVNLTVTNQSDDYIKQFIRYWVPLVDNVQIYPFLTEDLRLDSPRFFSKHQTHRRPFCSWPFDYMAILWNGEVTTCCHDINGINKLGNVRHQKISEVWSSYPFRQLRKEAITNSFEKESESHRLCRGCNAWKLSLVTREKNLRNIRVIYNGLHKKYQISQAVHPGLTDVKP